MEFLLPILAYLMGSISSAILIARLFGMSDPRTVGSGNPGATNILRQGNKAAAAATLIGDMAKGILPVVLARLITDDATTLAMVAGAAFLGHLFPVFFRLKGGKGVATALGVYFGLNIWMGLALVLTWLLSAAIFRYSSLAAILTAVISPLYAWHFLPGTAYLIMSFLIALLLVWRHHGNISRLITGREDKIRLSRK
jgi:glycerol-3-phosphate acyltransferase PlsY